MGALRLVVIAILNCLCLASCVASRNTAEIVDSPELVMPLGSSITGPSNEGRVTVSAVTPFGRRYDWDHATTTLDLWPRTRRWYGEAGIYLPRLTSRSSVLSHVVLEEGQLHFRSTADVMKYLVSSNSGGPGSAKTSWTRDGLATSFHFERGRGLLILEADVVQCCVNGEKPRNLSGASAAIAMRDGKGKRISTLPCAHVGDSAYFETWSRDHGFQ